MTGWNAQRRLGLYLSNTVVEAALIWSSGWERKQSVIEFSGTSKQPASETKRANCSSCKGASYGWTARDVGAPDSRIALWKRGATPSLWLRMWWPIWKDGCQWLGRTCYTDVRFTEWAPAESPNIVTSFLSPPKFSMLSWTHCKRNIWSWSPRFTMSSSKVSLDGRNPSAPIL